MPGPIRCLAFFERPSDATAILPTPPGLGRVGRRRAWERRACSASDLSNWDAPPVTIRCAIDVRRGRLMFGTSVRPPSGTAPRRQLCLRVQRRARRRHVQARGAGRCRTVVVTVNDPADPGTFGTVRGAPAQLATLQARWPHGHDESWTTANFDTTVIEIADNRHLHAGRRDAVDSTASAPPKTRARHQARDRTAAAHRRRHRGIGYHARAPPLHGLVIAGQLRITGPVQELRIAHCTLVPGLGLTPTASPRHPAE